MSESENKPQVEIMLLRRREEAAQTGRFFGKAAAEIALGLAAVTTELGVKAGSYIVGEVRYRSWIVNYEAKIAGAFVKGFAQSVVETAKKGSSRINKP